MGVEMVRAWALVCDGCGDKCASETRGNESVHGKPGWSWVEWGFPEGMDERRAAVGGVVRMVRGSE